MAYYATFASSICQTLDGRSDGRTFTWPPQFLGWIDNQIFLAVGRRSRLPKDDWRIHAETKVRGTPKHDSLQKTDCSGRTGIWKKPKYATLHHYTLLSYSSFGHLRPQIAKDRRGGRRGKVKTVITDVFVSNLNKLCGYIRITEKQDKVTKYI